MSKYTNEQLIEMYRRLPKDVQEAIISVDTSEIIKEIGEKRKLMIDKTGELADETGLVMLGITHPSQYISNLAERLEVNKELAKEIAEEINARIFFPIRENLRKMHETEETTPTPSVAAPAMPEHSDGGRDEKTLGVVEPTPGIFEAKTIDPYREPTT